jgi:geranylgeranyl pyrophosphate synthase
VRRRNRPRVRSRKTAIETLHKHRALQGTIERARHYGAMVRDALELFPASPWKFAMNDIVDFCINRAQNDVVEKRYVELGELSR